MSFLSSCHNRGIVHKKHEIACLHPVFIVNPNLPELVSKYGHYYFHGQHFYNKYRFLPLFTFDLRPFRQYIDKLTLDNVDEHYVVDPETGEMYPIFLVVPCGKCELCLDKKVQSFVNRIKYESFLYSFKPIFTTLTYNDESLPSCGVSVRDCQLFLKRFRQRLYRAGFTQKIRYVLVSEYGKRTKRAHYHAIFFGLPIRNNQDLLRIQSLIQLAWSNGFTLSREVDMSSPSTAYYTCKYLRKSCKVPPNHNSTFCLSSRGHGGIGSGFFRKQFATIFRKPRCEFDVFNPWTLKTEKFMWSSYSLDKLAPSVKKSIPLELRKALMQFCIGFNYVRYFANDIKWLYETTAKHIKDKYSSLLFLPSFDVPLYQLPSGVEDYRIADMQSAERIINKYKKVDFDHVLQCDKNRQYLLSNFRLGNLSIDLVQKVSRINRNIKRLEKLEKL